MSPSSNRHNTPETDSSGDWRHRAACESVDPELFFPIGEVKAGNMYEQQAEKAKAVCAECTVAEACLRYALRNDENFGIWGGTTEDERKAIKRRAARKRMGSRATSEMGVY